MKNITFYLFEKWLPKEEWIKQQRELKKKSVCAFNKYDDVTEEMVNNFWSQKDYAEKLIDKKDIRKEFQDIYDVAKKNVAMLDYAMKPTYTVYFDKEGNLYILINHGASWSAQNHLHHYAGKCGKYFTLETAASADIDKNEYELLYNKKY